jgi:hypothetical protein
MRLARATVVLRRCGLDESIWAVTAAGLAAVTAIAQVVGGEDHQAVLQVIVHTFNER